MLKDLRDVEALSELGVLFLLFEQGLELSLDRLKVGGPGRVQQGPCVCVSSFAYGNNGQQDEEAAEWEDPRAA
jgi:hypothetical protein